MTKQPDLAWYSGMERQILSFLRLDFLAQAKKEVARKDAELAREIAGRFSRGNLSIQRGRFLTIKDLDDRRSHVAKLQFKT